MHKDDYGYDTNDSDENPGSNLLWWCQYCNIGLKGENKFVEKTNKMFGVFVCFLCWMLMCSLGTNGILSMK